MRKTTVLKGILTTVVTFLSLTIVYAQSAGTFRGGTVSYEVLYGSAGNATITYTIELAIDFDEFTTAPTGGEQLNGYGTMNLETDISGGNASSSLPINLTVDGTAIDAANEVAIARGTIIHNVSFNASAGTVQYFSSVADLVRPGDLVNNSSTAAKLVVGVVIFPTSFTQGQTYQSSQLSIDDYLQVVLNNETDQVTVTGSGPFINLVNVDYSAVNPLVSGMNTGFSVPSFVTALTESNSNGVISHSTSNTLSGNYSYQISAALPLGAFEVIPLELTYRVEAPAPPCEATISTGDTVFGGDPSVFYGGLSIYRNLFVDSDGSGPYTYNWVDAADPNTLLGTSRKLQVTPTQTATYVGTVTDANNCSASASYTVSYEDITCGSSYWGSPKVSLCKINGWGTNNGTNPITVCVSKYIAYWLVGFGGNSYYTPGACSSSSKNGVVYDLIDETTVYPNPNNGQFTLSYMLYETSEIEMQLTDMMGNVYYQETVTEEADLYNKEMKFEDLNTGMYILTLKLNDATIHEKVQIIR